MAICKSVRFMNNNLLPGSSFYSATSATAAGPASNAADEQRSRAWIPAGFFVVESGVDDKLYFNDGADQTATITGQEYATGAALATEIQTQMNAASSNWTCTYDTATGKFTIDRTTGAAVLQTSTTTTAIWDVIGYSTALDLFATPFVADIQRNHCYEAYKIDLGVPTEVDFFGAVGPIDEVFGLSRTATVYIQANNVDVWTAPPLAEQITVDSDRGLFHYVAASAKYYRYWRFYFKDKDNPLGSQGVKLGYLYFGGYKELTSTNIARGFKKQLTDRSKELVTESGARFFDTRTPYQNFDSLVLQNITRAERLELEQFFRDFSTTQPYIISIDPNLAVSDHLDELTAYGYFQQQPALNHLFLDYYSITFAFREAS